MAGVISTGSTPKALWPGISAWWGRGYAERDQEWKDLFAVQSSKQAYEELVSVTGFGLAPVKTEGASTLYDSEVQGFVSRAVHVAYALGYVVTHEEIEDNLYEKVSGTRANALGFSFRQTKENVGANIYNRAFNATYTGGDGVALLSTAHPQALGGTYSNKLAVDADLSEASLEDLTIQIQGAQDDRGLIIGLNPGKLIIPRQEMYNAKRILGSDYQSGTANNDINAMKAMAVFKDGFTMNHYLSSPHAFFIRTDIPEKQGMIHFKREAVKFTDDNDFDTENMKYKGYERYSFVWGDPRALFGSNGP